VKCRAVKLVRLLRVAKAGSTHQGAIINQIGLQPDSETRPASVKPVALVIRDAGRRPDKLNRTARDGGIPPCGARGGRLVPD
jgi:hypothetical protein